MDKPSPGRFLTDRLLEMDEARNARPHEPQVASQIVKEREARLSEQGEKIAALKRAREAASTPSSGQPPMGVTMAKRELIDSGTDKRYVRRNKLGTSFVESDDVGRSLAADRRTRAKTKSNLAKATRAIEPIQKPSAKPPPRAGEKQLSGRAPLGSLSGRRKRPSAVNALPHSPS
jgi:hypothetical protein